MSYDLCLLKQAKQPYYIESIRTGIYSLEELCFYFYNNIYLIDESIVNEKLCDWIRDELHLTRLYHVLYEQLEQMDSVSSFVIPIFREAGYLTSREMQEYQEELEKLEIQPDEVKQKLRGDYLVKEGMYARAIWEYRRILKNKNPGKLQDQFYAVIWNNLGTAYAGLFQFEDAADCFYESYKLQNSRETFRKYISTLPLFLSEEDYQDRLKELQTDKDLVSTIQEYNAKLLKKQEYLEESAQVKSRPMDEVIEDLKEEYSRNTMT